MSKINVLIVEDESIVAKDIEQSLKKLNYNVVGICPTGENAITRALEQNPDIVLMDIMLKGEITGIEAAERIRDHIQIPVVYLTAYADDATLQKAKVTEPYGYIIKPFKEIDLHTNIEMAIYKFNRNQEVQKERDLLHSLIENNSDSLIFVRSKNGLVKLENSSIAFVEALKDYVRINTDDSRYTVHSTMKEIDKKLASKEFLRVHRSYIININKIEKIEQNELILKNVKKVIPIGGSFKDTLMDRIQLV